MDKKEIRIIAANIMVLIIAILGVLIFRRIFVTTLVSGKSMEPNFKENQIVMMHIFLDLDRFDCVMIKSEKQLFKRVIGLPGETVEYKDNKLYINGVEIEDKYAQGKTENFKVILAENEYFCMGDNREISKDSRALGPFKREQIKAKM